MGGGSRSTSQPPAREAPPAHPRGTTEIPSDRELRRRHRGWGRHGRRVRPGRRHPRFKNRPHRGRRLRQRNLEPQHQADPRWSQVFRNGSNKKKSGIVVLIVKEFDGNIHLKKYFSWCRGKIQFHQNRWQTVFDLNESTLLSSFIYISKYIM